MSVAVQAGCTSTELPVFQTRVVGRDVWGFDCPHCGITHFHRARAGEHWSHCTRGPLLDQRIVLLAPAECAP
ncbi:MAG: hypothetical protein AB1761_16770 [Pseudomonadota bacterium]